MTRYYPLKQDAFEVGHPHVKLEGVVRYIRPAEDPKYPGHHLVQTPDGVERILSATHLGAWNLPGETEEDDWLLRERFEKQEFLQHPRYVGVVCKECQKTIWPTSKNIIQARAALVCYLTGHSLVTIDQARVIGALVMERIEEDYPTGMG